MSISTCFILEKYTYKYHTTADKTRLIPTTYNFSPPYNPSHIDIGNISCWYNEIRLISSTLFIPNKNEFKGDWNSRKHVPKEIKNHGIFHETLSPSVS